MPAQRPRFSAFFGRFSDVFRTFHLLLEQNWKGGAVGKPEIIQTGDDLLDFRLPLVSLTATSSRGHKHSDPEISAAAD